MTEMAAQRDPLLHFSAEKGRGEEGKAAVNTLLLRTGQGCPKMAQERRGTSGQATVQKTTAVMKQTSQFAGTGLDRKILSQLSEIQTIKDKLRSPCSVSPVGCDMPTDRG